MATASGHTVREQPVCHPIHCVNTGCRDGAARLGTYTAARVGSQERPPPAPNTHRFGAHAPVVPFLLLPTFGILTLTLLQDTITMT